MIASIHSVVSRLQTIVDDAREESSPLGYFAALYKRVTIEVARAIEAGAFDDAERMEQLDIRFAERYLQAYRARRDGGNLTRSWSRAFDAAENPRLIVLQHLLLGMNAHISLDLGIAAAEVAPRSPLALKNDFHHINRILGSLIDDTQRRLTRVFGPLGILDRLLGPIDERVSLFSIDYARDKAWTQALELCLVEPNARERYIETRDLAVAGFSDRLIAPPRLLHRLVLPFVRLLERGDVRSRIHYLDS